MLQTAGQMLSLVVQLAIPLGIGMLAGRFHFLGENASSILTNLILQIVLPVNILMSFVDCIGMDLFEQLAVSMALAVGTQLVAIALGYLLYGKKIPGEQRGVYRFNIFSANMLMTGKPIIDTLYGAAGSANVAVFMIPNRVAMWSVGLAQYTGEKTNRVKKLLLNPCIVTVFAGILLLVLKVELPAAVCAPLKAISASCTPLCMIVLGMILTQMNDGRIFSRETLLFSFYRLILLPGLTYLLCLVLQIPELLRAVAVILMASPGGIISVLLAKKYDMDEACAAKCVIASTTLAVIAMPLWSIIAAG